MKHLALMAMSILTLLTGCSRSGPVEGGLYFIHNDTGSYSVIKILKVDNGGVHVRLYSNQFPTPPDKVDESTLYLAGMDRKPDESLGMGHVPLSTKTFAGWHATFFQQSIVKEDELDGYKMWLDAKGGYF